jgi:hypothetical protein
MKMRYEFELVIERLSGETEYRRFYVWAVFAWLAEVKAARS